jgi:hypothetical protein
MTSLTNVTVTPLLALAARSSSPVEGKSLLNVKTPR